MMQELKVLELFSGTGSFSKVCSERGHKIFRIDNDPRFEAEMITDIFNVTPDMIREHFGQPDVIWASPPCQKFSVMTIYRNWKDGKPKNDETKKAVELVKHTLYLIAELKPKYWIIENPRAMLRKQEFMPNINRKTVTYCKYGMAYMKPTDIWTNIFNWKPRLICKAGSPCHVKASRGSKAGIQSDFKNLHKGTRKKMLWKSGHLNFIYSTKLLKKDIRGTIPKELCLELIKAIEVNYD